MAELFASNGFFSILITLSAFAAGRALQQKWKTPLLNPLVVAAVLVGLFLTLVNIPVPVYQSGCGPLQYLLTPATICYAISLYEQLSNLRKHLAAILAGVVSGTLVSLGSILAMCRIFGLDHVLELSLLPKSITTAIGMAISQEAGGVAALTTAAIVMTGVLGNMFGPAFCKLFGIHHPIAQGVAYGTASHAVGTSKAAELSPLTGAVSSMSLTLAGLITVVLYSFLV